MVSSSTSYISGSSSLTSRLCWVPFSFLNSVTMPHFPTANDCYLNYDVQEPGPGTPINLVLIHGYYCNMHVWDGYNRLLDKNVRVIRVDLYSHGQSSRAYPPAAADEDLESARDIVLLMKKLALGQYFVAGHSFGGRVAELVALEDKDNVLGAILITPLPILGMKVAIEDLVRPLVEALTSNEETFRDLASVVLNGGLPMRRDSTKEFMASLHHSFIAEGSNPLARSVSLRTNRSSILSTISSPLLFITGGKDFYFKETVEELALFTNTAPKLHSFHDLGHMFPITDPTYTAAVITAFIRNHQKIS